MAAAVADYRAAEVAELKRSKEEAGGPRVSLELVENEDILAGLVAARSDGQTIVGFAAETATDAADLRERGRRKRRRKGVDLLAVNEVGWSKGFETADNARRHHRRARRGGRLAERLQARGRRRAVGCRAQRARGVEEAGAAR